MKILVVASFNKGQFAPFITEQVDTLRKSGVDCEYYGVVGNGISGYLKNMPALLRKIRSYRPDIVQAHFGLCGLLANLQRDVPVITTYHGSDINIAKNLRLSKIAMTLSAYNIFVSQKNIELSGVKKRYALLPCGIDTDVFHERDKMQARKELGWNENQRYVLFAGAFDNSVKNPELAKQATALIPNLVLIELKGYRREQVCLLMNAVDCLLLTSHTEGSPQVIKEAMACGCPIVSVDVGDVSERIADLEGCYIADRTPEDVAAKLCQALSFQGRTQGRQRIMQLGLDHHTISEKLKSIIMSIAETNK